MNFVRKNYMAIILYFLVMGFVFLLSSRVEQFESKEDYYKYNEQIVMNLKG